MRKIGIKGLMIIYVTALIMFSSAFLAIFYAVTLFRYERDTLLVSLKSRISLLLSNISLFSEEALKSANVRPLESCIHLSDSLEEVESVTITGYPSHLNAYAPFSLRYVWATNDKNIAQNINTDSFIPGFSLYVENGAKEIEEICEDVNRRALLATRNLRREIDSVDEEYFSLKKNSEKSKKILDLYEKEASLRLKIADELLPFSEEKSLPDFDNFCRRGLFFKKADGIYFLFYKPILFYSKEKRNLVNGIIFAKINMTPYERQLAVLQKSIYETSLKIFLFISAFGIFASSWYAGKIVNPIREIEKFVIRLTRERHKERLSGAKYNLQLHRRDEIGNLCEAINLLKEELSHASREAALQLDGKVVQRAFLPFPNSSSASFFRYKQKFLEISGYYEGASSISGDYFDYKKIDERRYAFIKGDVSGHGVAAGLIVSVIATLFREYFTSWRFHVNGTRVNELVIKINDFLYEMNLPARFAAFIVLLFDCESGELFVSNAGDSQLHLFRAKTASLEKIALNLCPAAGPISSDAVIKNGGFIVEKFYLEKGDVLFLYTDGIEESLRCFFTDEREEKSEEYVSFQEEAFTEERIHAVIESVMQGMCFSLKRQGETDAHFDFSTCEPSPCEAIKAIVAVEQVFRLTHSPKCTFHSGLSMNREIDEFLQKHFLDYSTFFTSNKEENGETHFFPLLREDEQQDDFAIFAIRRI